MIHSRFRLTPRDWLQRRLRNACADWLARAGGSRAAAQLACFPRDYIGRHIVANGLFDDLALRCLFETTFAAQRDAFRTGTALDVGANIGNHSSWLAGFFHSVVAFEPNPVCARLFEANVLMNRLDNVTLIAQGLSDHAGPALLKTDLQGNLGGSRLAGAGLDQAGLDEASLDQAARSGATQHFTVQLQRGDDALARLPGLPPVRLVKLDVEGHEHAALRGLAQTLRRDLPLVLFESMRAGGPDGSAAILALLRGLGYRHVYVVENDTRQPGGRLARLLRRLTRGYQLEVIAVEQPQDRFHSHIIACADAL